MYCQNRQTQTSTRRRGPSGSLLRRCGLSWVCMAAVVFAASRPVVAQQRSAVEKSRSQSASGKIDPRLAQRIVQQAQSTRSPSAADSSRTESVQQQRPKSGIAPSSRMSSGNRDAFEAASASGTIRRVSHDSPVEDRKEENTAGDTAEFEDSDSGALNSSAAPVVQATRKHAAPLMPTPQPEKSTFVTEAERSDSEQSGDVAAAGYKVTEKPAAVFLDLTGAADHSDSATASQLSVVSSELGSGAEVTAAESPAHVVMRAVAWVVIALCLFSLGALGVRRWQRQRGLLPAPNSRSRVLETLSLGPGKTVSLIEMAGYRALVASDAGGIRQLVLASSSFNDDFAEMEQDVNAKPVASTAYQLSDFRSHLPASAD